MKEKRLWSKTQSYLWLRNEKSFSCSSCLSHSWPIASPCVRSFEPFLADQMTLPGPSIHSRGRFLFVPLCVLRRPRFGLKFDICEIGQSWRETGWGRRFTLIHCGLDLRFIYNVTCLTQASLFNPFFRFRYICRISQMWGRRLTLMDCGHPRRSCPRRWLRSFEASPHSGNNWWSVCQSLDPSIHWPTIQ